MSETGERRTGVRWVQTDRAAHEAWARLTLRKPRAAALMHRLVAQMGRENGVVISQKLLAKQLGCSVDTIKRAIRDLVAGQWISVVRLNGPGTVNAYVVNDRVGWTRPREDLYLSTFSATVVADWEDQDETALGAGPLRDVPAIAPGWEQLPSGPGEPPPSEPPIEGLEPDLPALQDAEPNFAVMAEVTGPGYDKPDDPYPETTRFTTGTRDEISGLLGYKAREGAGSTPWELD